MNVSAAQRIDPSSGVGRPKKFTPERIQQIINLVERGKSRAEIAQLIGVPVGSLAVTCSRLGISLRAPRLSNGVRLLHAIRPARAELIDEPTPPQHESTSSSTSSRDAEKSSIDDEANALPLLELRIIYKGKERTYRMPLPSETITHLALEAQLQEQTMGELIMRLITRTLQTSLANSTQALSPDSAA
jgi:hypothetical protein